MGKVKVNSGLASVIVLASLFAGWQTLLIVVALLLLFCDMDEKVKGIIVKVVSFYAALALVSLGWGLITDLVDLIIESLDKLIAVVNGYLDYANRIDITKLTAYVLNPVSSLVDIADGIISYLLVFAKFAFIIAVLGNKQVKENPIIKKINEFVEKVVAFINNIEVGNVAQETPTSVATNPAPVAQAQVAETETTTNINA
ncbi:MAG: hypothetical protein J5982_01780 [Bacilli bacterium]|nr:hypothetical protein [Bacilli bacterium]